MTRVPAAPRLQPLHVLVVDDDAAMGRLLDDALPHDLFTVAAVPDEAAASAALQAERYGILLIDIGHPEHAGIDRMVRLRQIQPDLDIVVVAVDASVPDAIAALNAGAGRYIQKPCAPDELRAVFTDLRERRLLKERARLYLRRLEVQNSLSDELSSALQPGDVARAAIEAVRQLAPVPVVLTVAERTGSDDIEVHARPLAWAGVDGDTAATLARLPEVRDCLSRAPVSAPGMAVVPAPEGLASQGLRAVALVRLRGRSRDLGVLIAAVGPQQALDEHHWDLLVAMSNWIGVALERTLLYQRLERAFDEAGKTQRHMIQTEKQSAIGRLAAGLAHEIGTPLNVISGRAELLLEEFGHREPRMAQGLGTIVAQIERISKLVAQLLDFARESRPARERVALASVLTAVLDLLKRPLAQASIDVDTTLPPDLPPIVAHANQMQQVFLNLLLNSIDAIEADPAHGNTKRRGRITIEAESLGEDRRVRVRVRDNGHGIRPEDLDRVFDPFFTTKPVGAGTGLGLSVVYGIVLDHQGTIAVESAPEVGTVVTLTMPTEAT